MDNKRSLGALLCALALISSPAVAQSGTLDQISPYPNALHSNSFNADVAGIVWQAQVRVGVAGQLEGFKLRCMGPAGSSTNVRVRLGNGWNTSPIKFQATVTKTSADTQALFVDTTSANIVLAVNATFVIEIAGNGPSGSSAIWLLGSWVDPSSGPAEYPELLFLNGPGCYNDCGSRIGFKTYMIASGPGSVTPYCFGANCPCGNDDATAGCKNSTGHGALLAQTAGGASIAADNLSMAVTHMPTNVVGVIFAGNEQASTPFHDGRRCVQGVVKRFGVQNAGSTGSISFSHPVLNSSGSMTTGSTWYFQCWYRDASGPCAHDLNLSNGLQVTFGP